MVAQSRYELGADAAAQRTVFDLKRHPPVPLSLAGTRFTRHETRSEGVDLVKWPRGTKCESGRETSLGLSRQVMLASARLVV